MGLYLFHIDFLSISINQYKVIKYVMTIHFWHGQNFIYIYIVSDIGL